MNDLIFSEYIWPGRKKKVRAFAPVEDFTSALESFMLGRLGILYTLLAVVILTQVFGQPVSPFHFALGYALLALGFAFNLVQALTLDKLPANWWLIVSHILFDTALTSTWVYYSGGPVSVYALLYLVQILVSALVFYHRAALFSAASSSIGFGLVAIVSEGGNFFSWSIYSGLFFVLAWVGGYLSEELFETTRSLKEKQLTIDKLQSFHEKIIGSLPTGWMTVDQQMRVNFINPAGAHILGQEPGAIVGKPLVEVEPGLMPFFDQIQDARVEEPADTERETEVSSTGNPLHPSFFMQTKDHARLQQTVTVKTRVLRGDVAEIDAHPALGQFIAQDASKGRVLLFHDVTKLLHLEEKLKQHEKLAAVGQLAAGIAHEIRNPLASMSGSIELLRDTLPEKDVSAEERKLMDIALKEIDRLNRLISEFLDFVRPDKMEIKDVSLPDLLGELVLSARQRKESIERIEIRENYEPGVTAKASSEKLRQVIWNLLVNALQAMDKAGTIEVGCQRAGINRVRFWVRDEGNGMSDETLHRLFEPFFTTKPRGTGLGLATAYKIVEAHLGEIRVKSELKRGTEFEVILPAA